MGVITKSSIEILRGSICIASVVGTRAPAGRSKLKGNGKIVHDGVTNDDAKDLPAPRTAATSLWIVVFLDTTSEDGGFQWLDEIFTDPVEAMENGAPLAGEGEELRLYQLILDPDHPARWANRVLSEVLENFEPSDAVEAEIALNTVDRLEAVLKDTTPNRVDDLPSDGDRLDGPVTDHARGAAKD